MSKQSSVISGGSGENIFEIKEIKYETGNIGQCGFLYSLSRSSEPISDNYKYCVRINSSEFISIVKQKVGHFFFEKELKTGNSIKITVPNFNLYTGPVQYKKDYLITANSRAIIINIPTSETSKPYFIKDDFYEEQKEFRFVTEFDFWEKSKRRMVHSDKYCLVSRLRNLGNIAVLLHSSST